MNTQLILSRGSPYSSQFIVFKIKTFVLRLSFLLFRNKILLVLVYFPYCLLYMKHQNSVTLTVRDLNNLLRTTQVSSQDRYLCRQAIQNTLLQNAFGIPLQLPFYDLLKKYRADTPRLPEPLHKTSHRLSHSWGILPDIIRTLCILRQNTDWQTPFRLRHPFSPDT